MKEFFSHDYNARHDRKISALVQAYKSSGYGIFWATCELMHEEGDRLEYDDITFTSISKDLNERKDYVKEVLDACIDTFKLFTKQDVLLTSNRVKRNLTKSEERKMAKTQAGRMGGIRSGLSRKLKQNEAVLRSKRSEVEANEPEKSKEEKSKEEKRESNTLAKNGLENSNLFRQPNIPKFEDVHRVFVSNGGTEEMAKTFYNVNEGLGWFKSGSPITNFSNLVPSYVENWKKNLNNSKNGNKELSEYEKTVLKNREKAKSFDYDK